MVTTISLATYPKLAEAIRALQAGRFIILLDDEKRENEGDLIIAAEYTTPNAVNFMAHHGRGLICLAMQETLVEHFELPLMTQRNSNPRECAFTVSIDAADGITTGISAQDRSTTILKAIDPKATAKDFVTPGHIFPLRAKKGGVLQRAGHTEGAVDLMQIAGLKPAATICEIMNQDGTMARYDDLIAFANHHAIPLITMQDIIEYRLQYESLVSETASTTIPIPPYGDFTLSVFTNHLDNTQHIALIKQPIDRNDFILTRLHSECFTGDIFGSARCDCGWQLDQAITKIGQHGGIILYLKQEGRGIGLINKLKAYNLQDQGFDTVEANLQLGFAADQRDYWIGAQILQALNIQQVRLLTNNPDKIKDLEHYRIKVKREPIVAPSTHHNEHYLCTKRKKLKHFI